MKTDRMRIRGGKPLHGAVRISGSKNAALPILISSLVSGGTCVFERTPNLEDVRTTLKLLSHMGVKEKSDLISGRVELDASRVENTVAPYELVSTMRASVVVLGPLLARFGRARVSMPGGCAIGARPINLHLTALEALGAKLDLENGDVVGTVPGGRLKGARVRFEFPSVGATENALMAAALADGESSLENCAREPEISDLAGALRAMGARIEGDGTANIHVQGQRELKGCSYSVMGDRIEAGTFLAAALATRGSVTVNGISPSFLEAVLAKFEESGALVERGKDSITLRSAGRPRAADVTTAPYPGFPTDMQAQLMSLMAVADGASVITETIFENRFMHVPELVRMGADIAVRGNTALVRGQPKLRGAPIMATDLRASASLVLAGLCAEGETTVSRIYHLDRGYESMETKLRQLGAEIDRIA